MGCSLNYRLSSGVPLVSNEKHQPICKHFTRLPNAPVSGHSKVCAFPVEDFHWKRFLMQTNRHSKCNTLRLPFSAFGLVTRSLCFRFRLSVLKFRKRNLRKGRFIEMNGGHFINEMISSRSPIECVSVAFLLEDFLKNSFQVSWRFLSIVHMGTMRLVLEGRSAKNSKSRMWNGQRIVSK